MTPDTTPVASFRDGLEKANQIRKCKVINFAGTVLGHGKRTDPQTKPNADRFSKRYSDRLLGGPGVRIR